MSWLVGYSEHFGEQMPAVGSSLLIPGSEAQVAWGDHKVKICGCSGRPDLAGAQRRART